MTYFTNCTTLDALKAAYKELVWKHHPDRGGDTATMQAINAEYQERFEALKSGAADAQTAEMPEDFVKILEVLLKLEGLDVELCGRWLWIGGNTRPNKEALKTAGCRWSRNKGLWYWHPAQDGKRMRKGSVSMEEIREKYGSQTFQNGTHRTRNIPA